MNLNGNDLFYRKVFSFHFIWLFFYSKKFISFMLISQKNIKNKLKNNNFILKMIHF